METKESRPYASPSAQNSPSTGTRFGSVRLWIAAFVFAALCVPVAFVIGAIAGNSQIYNNLANYQQRRIESVLREDTEAYGELTVKHASNGWAYPTGTVGSQEDFDRLSDRLHRMFGDELAEKMMSHVSVR